MDKEIPSGKGKILSRVGTGFGGAEDMVTNLVGRLVQVKIADRHGGEAMAEVEIVAAWVDGHGIRVALRVTKNGPPLFMGPGGKLLSLGYCDFTDLESVR